MPLVFLGMIFPIGRIQRKKITQLINVTIFHFKMDILFAIWRELWRDSLSSHYTQLLFTFCELNVDNYSLRGFFKQHMLNKIKYLEQLTLDLVITLHSSSLFMTKLEHLVMFGDNSHTL